MGTAFEAGAQVAGGFGRAQARKSAAKVAEFEAAQTLVQQDQNTANRMDELNRTLASIDAITAGGNIDPSSATGRAIKASRRKSTKEALIQENLGFALARTSKRSEAAAQRRAAPFDIINGFAQASATMSDAAAKAMAGGGGG